jgi:hypothetical protein
MTTTIILSSVTPVLKSDNTFTPSWYLLIQDIVKAIRGALGLMLGGNIFVSGTPVSNVNGGATDLISYNFPANKFININDFIEIKAWGTFANNANNKEVKLYFGTQVIADTGSIAANNTSWSFNAKIIRTGDTSQVIMTDGFFNGSSFSTKTVGTQNSNSQITIKCTGTGVATNDVTQNALVVKLTPYT